MATNGDNPNWIGSGVEACCPKCGYGPDEIGTTSVPLVPKEGDRIYCDACGYLATVVPDGIK